MDFEALVHHRKLVSGLLPRRHSLAMSILTSYERLGLIALSFGLLACAVLHMVSSGPSSSCWTPPEFTTEMSSYARRVCATEDVGLYELPVVGGPIDSIKKSAVSDHKDIMKWGRRLPKRLFNAVILVLVPLVIAEILARIFNVIGANEKKLSKSSMVVKSLAELLCRAAFFACVLSALVVVKADPLRLESLTSSRSLLCDFDVRSMSNVQRYTIQCVLTLGQGLVISTTLIHLLKRLLVIVTGWAAIGFAQSLIFIACPKTRLSFLRSSPDDNETESNGILNASLS